jgi:predicted pyridoxine 5'-phosphate oxidase superfamily flavin-nucleotide-binding protein
VLTDDMKRVIREQMLGFVATVGGDGAPNLSPKGSFFIVDDATIAFGEIRSPGTIRNLRANPRIDVNFVDPFLRKGYRFGGMARVVSRGDAAFESLLRSYGGTLAARFRAIVAITITRASEITSPVYDDGRSEATVRADWTRRFESLRPGGRFAD